MQTEKDTSEQTWYETDVEIKNTDGLHMRPAMKFVDVASRFECDITVSNGQTEVDGKSIMQMSMLAATRGTRLKLRASGPDGQKAIEALRELVENKMLAAPPSDEQKKS